MNSSDLLKQLNTAIANLKDRKADLGRKQNEMVAASDTYNKAVEEVRALKSSLDTALTEDTANLMEANPTNVMQSK